MKGYCKTGQCGGRQNGATVEQECRDILERIGVDNAQQYSAGQLAEMANLLSDRRALQRQLAASERRTHIANNIASRLRDLLNEKK